MDHHVNSWVSMISNNSPPPSSPLCDEHKSQISDSLGSECPDSSMQDSLNSPVDFSKEVEQCYSVCLFSFLCHGVLTFSRCPGTFVTSVIACSARVAEDGDSLGI